jgi:quinol monooxygenase YgiN
LFPATYLLIVSFHRLGINLVIYPQIMIIASIRIDPMPDKRQAVIEILMSVKNMTRLKPGCTNCEIYEEHGDGQKILYIEKWRSKEAMYQHIQSKLYLRVLNAIEFSSEPPEICFHEDPKTTGIELIEAIRIKTTAKTNS